MSKLYFLFSLFWMFSSFSGGGLEIGDRSTAVEVVANGRAMAFIVLADQPSPMAVYAADELVFHLEKATGVRLEIVAESEASESDLSRIYIGMTQAAQDRKLMPLDLGPDAFVLRTVGNELYVLGSESISADPLDENSHSLSGTLFGVYELLERYLQVRWLWPGELGTYVPLTDSVVVGPLDEVVTPKLKFREFRYWDVTQAMDNYTPEVKNLAFSEAGLRSYARDMNIFSRRHRISHALKPEVGHYFGGWWEEHGEEHPEWFAMRADGGRGPAPNQQPDRVCMCVSNPELHRYIVEEAWDGGDLLRLGEGDSKAYCQCPDCLSWDGPQPEDAKARIVTDRYVRFWKTIYDMAVKKNPRVKVSTFLYVNYFPAPLTDIKLNENFYGEFVPFSNFMVWYPADEALLEWQKEQWLRWRETGIAMGYRPNHPKAGYAMPHVNTWQGGEFIRFANGQGMAGIDFDALSGQWAVKGPEHYMYYRLLVHPDQPVGEIRAEYFSAFGPAAGLVEQYFDYWEDHNHRLQQEGRWSDIRFNPTKAPDQYPPEVFPPAEKILREALSLAEASADKAFTGRIHFLMNGLQHAQLSARAIALLKQDDPDAGKALQALINFRKEHEKEYISNYVYLAIRCERRFFGDKIDAALKRH